VIFAAFSISLSSIGEPREVKRRFLTRHHQKSGQKIAVEKPSEAMRALKKVPKTANQRSKTNNPTLSGLLVF